MGLLKASATIVAFLAHTHFPVAAVVEAVLAVSRKEHIEDWRNRLVSAIADWIGEHGDLMVTVDPDFEAVLLKALDRAGFAKLNPNDPRIPSLFLDALASVFAAGEGIKGGSPDATVAARALVDALPELLIQSAPEDAPLAPLRHLIGKDISELSAEIAQLGVTLGELQAELALGLSALTASRTEMSVLRRILEERHTQPADWVTVRAYLATVIDVLDNDPWTRTPDDRPLTLTDVQRKLSVRPVAKNVESSGTQGREAESIIVDADTWVDQCERLVVLGGPGSGKSWLARRSAIRAAELALTAITGPDSLERAEIPLFARCSQFALFATTSAPTTWLALVDAALQEIADSFHSDRVRQSLRLRFAEQPGYYLAILDGLDEAATTSRLSNVFSALTMAQRLRILITSRPTAWQAELYLDKDNARHRLAELLPLSHADVVAIVRSLLARSDGTDSALLAYLEHRPDLARAATVPLLCTMYCLVAGRGPLPDTRLALYDTVIDELLDGAWRLRPPPDESFVRSRAALSELAWQAAVNDPRTGLGAWDDNINTKISRDLDDRERLAIDHIAPLVQRRPAKRRFIHRSIREFLVATYLAGMPAVTAAKVIQPHLWFDPDWSEVIPYALALHPQRDKLLERLVGDKGESLVACLPGRDGLLELRVHLARVAGETKENDWRPSSAALIHQARAALGGVIGTLDESAALVRGRGWRESNHAIIASLLQRLPNNRIPAPGNDIHVSRRIVEAITELGPDESQRYEARAHLLDIDAEASQDGDFFAEKIVQLAPTGEERAETRSAIVRHLTTSGRMHHRILIRALVMLAQNRDEQCETLAYLLAMVTSGNVGLNIFFYRDLGEAISQLDPTPPEREIARNALLIGYASPFGGLSETALILLAKEPSERRNLRRSLMELIRQEVAKNSQSVRTYNDPSNNVLSAARTVALLSPERGERDELRAVLLALLSEQSFPHYMYRFVNLSVISIVKILGQIAFDPDEWIETRAALVAHLCNPSNYTDISIAELIAYLRPNRLERRKTRALLLACLPQAVLEDFYVANVLVLLAKDPPEKAMTRASLIRDLETGLPATTTVFEAAIRLHPDRGERARIRAVLIAWLSKGNHSSSFEEGPAALIDQLVPDDDEQASTRRALIDHLADAEPAGAQLLIKAFRRLDPDDDEQTLARRTLIDHMVGIESMAALHFAEAIADLDPNPDERDQILNTLIAGLPDLESRSVWRSTRIISRLACNSAARDRACAALLSLLRGREWRWSDGHFIVDDLAALSPGAEERAKVRAFLLDRLDRAERDEIGTLSRLIADFEPDLETLRRVIAVCPDDMLSIRLVAAATRRATPDREWIRFLPELMAASHRWLRL